MTQTVSAREVQAAGGLDKWAAKAAQNRPVNRPAPAATGDQNRARAAVPHARGRVAEDLLLGYDSERMDSDLERKYASKLEGMRRNCEIAAWQYEPITLRLADRTTYRPDFFLLFPDGRAGFHETKGFWRDDARAKIKMAAEQFPWFFFVAVLWDSKAKIWKFERFGRGQL